MPGAKIDGTTIRGANYLPSYARNTLQTWIDYDPELIDREMGFAAKLGLNSIRIFLHASCYERKPSRFLSAVGDFIRICGDHKLSVVPVLFDSWFGDYPDPDRYAERDWMANPGQHRVSRDAWPDLERYVNAVVERTRNHPAVLAWDIMNEPFVTDRVGENGGETALWEFVMHWIEGVRSLDSGHPLTVGFCSESRVERMVRQLDLVTFHNYDGDPEALRQEVRKAKSTAEMHGKPVVMTSVINRKRGQTFEMALPLLRSENVGWYLSDLMFGASQFTRGDAPEQGLLYPDGTCRRAAEVAAVMGVPATEAAAAFPERR